MNRNIWYEVNSQSEFAPKYLEFLLLTFDTTKNYMIPL